MHWWLILCFIPIITITQIDVTIQTAGKAASPYTIYRDADATKKIVPQQGKVYVFNVSFSPKTVAVSNSVASWGTQGETSINVEEETEEIEEADQ